MSTPKSEIQRLADHIEIRIWRVIEPAIADDVDLGQLRVNILDALEAALRSDVEGSSV